MTKRKNKMKTKLEKNDLKILNDLLGELSENMRSADVELLQSMLLEQLENGEFEQEDYDQEVKNLKRDAKKSKKLFCTDFILVNYLQNKINNILKGK